MVDWSSMTIEEFPGETMFKDYDPDKINDAEDLADYLTCLRAENNKSDTDGSKYFSIMLDDIIDVVDDCLIEDDK